MQIPCESCGTTYELDAHLIPAAGAPVQCTRCGHVFIAYRTSAPVPPPAPLKPQGGRRATGEFGIPAVEPLSSEEAEGTSGNTFTFSVPREVFDPDPVPSHAPQSAQPRPERTAIFASPFAPEAPPPARSSTQMFAAVPRVDPTLERIAAHANPFGSESVPPVRASTQMFAAPPRVEPTPERTAQSAIPFGSESAPPVRASTQMFAAIPRGTEGTDRGAGGETSAPSSHAAPLEEPAQPRQERTAIFASPFPPEAPQAARSSTQMFAAVPRDEPMDRGIGADASVHPEPIPGAAQPRPERTAIFASPFPPEAPQPVRASTQSFAASLHANPASGPTAQDAGSFASESAPPVRASTQIFAASLHAEPAAGPTAQHANPFASESAPPVRASTQIFAASLHAEPASEPTAQHANPFASESAPPVRASTQIFAASLHAEPAAEPTAQHANPFASESAPPVRASTQQFGAATETPPMGTARSGTQPFAAAAASQAVGDGLRLDSQVDAHGDALERAPRPARAPAAVRLPDDPLLDLGIGVDDSLAHDSDDNRRRNTKLLVGFLAVLLVLAGMFLLPRLFSGGPKLSPETLAAREDVVRLIRKDDAASRVEATRKLDALITPNPRYVEALSDRLILRAFELSDLRFESAWINHSNRRLQLEIDRLRQFQEPSDWQNRVHALEGEQATVNRRKAKLHGLLAAALGQVEEAAGALEAAVADPDELEERAITRAQAVRHGATGDARALELAERCRMRAGCAGWSAIALAEYAANSVVPPATVAEAREELRALGDSDQGFLRVFILDARLALAEKNGVAASEALDTVSAFNRKHHAIELLRVWASELERSAPAEDIPDTELPSESHPE